MESKIISFQKYLNKESSNEAIDKNTLLDCLNKIPTDLAKEYGWGLAAQIEELITFRDIVTSAEFPQTVKHLVAKLSGEQLARLQTIVDNITFWENEKALQKIINATWGTVEPSKQTIEKSKTLIELIMEIYSKRELIADKSKFYKLLSEAVIACEIVVKEGMNEEMLMSKFRTVPERELDALISLAKNYND